MIIRDSRPSFAAGELSPLLAARSDMASYSIGCRELRNCIALPQGGFCNRPGTRKLASGAAYQSARLVPFEAGDSASYCLVFRRDGAMDVIPEGAAAPSASVPHPVPPGFLSELRWLQSVDVMYLFHPRMHPKTLSRLSAGQWEFGEPFFRDGPYLDMNDDEGKKMRLTGAALESDFDFFTPGMVGTWFRLESKIPAASGEVWGVQDVPVYIDRDIIMYGPVTIETRGRWHGHVLIFRADPGEPFPDQPIRSWASAGDANFGYSASEEEYGVTYRIRLAGYTDYQMGHVAWSSGGGLIGFDVRASGYDSPRRVWVESWEGYWVSMPWTADWARGAFGQETGYPSMGIFHQERLILAATPGNPQTIWMSQSASWHHFGTTIPTEDTDAITITLASKRLNAIRGLASRGDLLVFTSGGEWAAKAGQKTDVLTPSSVSITPSGYRGSAPGFEPLDVGQSTLFVQRGGRVVRGLGYKLEIDGYDASEISILSEHMTELSPIRRWDWQQEPWGVVWMALGDGSVIALTLNQEHQVNAWARQTFNGPVSDLCCVRGEERDELYLLSGAGASAGVRRLNRRDDLIFSAPNYLDDGTDAYVSSFESMEYEADAGGTLQGRHKQSPGACVRVFRTGAIKAGVMTENSGKLDVIHSGSQLTGDITARLPGGAGRQCRIRIENSEPVPMTVLGIFQEVSVPDG